MDETFAGIDWASEEHALCVVDGGGATSEGEMHRCLPRQVESSDRPASPIVD
ncbi:MAG TPA: hypothetical protein VFC52_02395 [Solirubrobacterales bacterium]|nr:hypothetical protein [Solirubrobacterales bacterium]